MKVSVVIGVFLCLVSLLSVAAGNDVPESHRKISFLLADSVVQKVTADNPWLSAASVLFNTMDQPVNNHLKQQIIQSLVSRNVGVLLNQSSADTMLEFSVRELSLLYGEVFSESFFGRRKIVRTISLSVGVTISSVSSGMVFYSQNISATSIDTVFYSLVSQLHDDDLPLTTIVQPQLSFFDSILEPVIITVASGIAVYLFFTIRS